MTSPAASNPDQRALRRARQAMRCLPFRLGFYSALKQGALSSRELAGHPQRHKLCRQPVGARQAEDLFIWLIQLGVLRREVDGQGLTERVRLTPLGREVVESFGSREIQPPSPLLRLGHWLRRHRPRW